MPLIQERVGDGAKVNAMHVPRRFSSTWVAVLFALGIAASGGGCGGSSSVMSGNGGSGTPTPVPSIRDDWPMYGHDARHTSASVGSIAGSLKVAWRYNPVAAPSDTFSTVYNAVGTISGVYVHWFQSGVSILSAGPSVDAVSTGGGRTWTFVELRDYDEGHWLSIFNNGVVLQDDGEPNLDTGTGKVVKYLASSYDSWGETIPDPSGFYGANTFIADGPNLFVYSFDASNALRWKALQQTGTKYSQDANGGILLSNGVLFYAASYSDPVPHASGIYGLNSSTGTQVAYVAANPSSEMSADASNIYLVENNTSLVARTQSNLGAVWSTNIGFGSYAAPVLANGLVIVATGSGVGAYNASTGKVAWTSPVSVSYGGQYGTAMCAALGSNTLLVTGNDGLHVLNLATGAEIWHGAVAGAQGTVANPVIVNNPALGVTVYVTDSRGVIALIPG